MATAHTTSTLDSLAVANLAMDTLLQRLPEVLPGMESNGSRFLGLAQALSDLGLTVGRVASRVNRQQLVDHTTQQTGTLLKADPDCCTTVVGGVTYRLGFKLTRERGELCQETVFNRDEALAKFGQHGIEKYWGVLGEKGMQQVQHGDTLYSFAPVRIPVRGLFEIPPNAVIGEDDDTETQEQGEPNEMLLTEERLGLLAVDTLLDHYKRINDNDPLMEGDGFVAMYGLMVEFGQHIAELAMTNRVNLTSGITIANTVAQDVAQTDNRVYQMIARSAKGGSRTMTYTHEQAEHQFGPENVQRYWGGQGKGVTVIQGGGVTYYFRMAKASELSMAQSVDQGQFGEPGAGQPVKAGGPSMG